MAQGRISFVTAVLMSINIMVGAGIYVSAPFMTAQAGNLSFLGWLVVAFIFAPVIWCVASAARMFPEAGGIFNYCKSGINESMGFIAAWAYLLGFLATAATQTMVLKDLLFSELNFSLVKTQPMLFNALFVFLLIILNLLSIKLISRIQGAMTVIKLIPIFSVITLFIFYWNPSLTYPITNAAQLMYTIPFAIFAYWGFESCCNISHFLKGGPPKVFSVILTAFIIVMFLYSLFHFGLLHIMGPAALSSLGVRAFPDFLHIQNGMLLRLVKSVIVGTLVLNFANAIYGVLLTCVANLASTAERKLIFFSKPLSATNRYLRPVGSVVSCSLVVFFFLTCVPYKEILVAISNMGVLIAIFSIVMAVFRTLLRNRASIVQLLPSCLAFVSCAIFGYFSWLQMGSNNMLRFVYAIPLIVGLLLGYFLYQLKKRQLQRMSS